VRSRSSISRHAHDGAALGALPPTVGDRVRDVLERPELRLATVTKCELKAWTARRIVCALELADDVPFPSRSVILKCPSRETSAAVMPMRRELAAMRYVAALRTRQLAAIAPKIYYEDRQRGIVVMEDLTAERKAQRLHDLLLRPDGWAAAAGLKRLVQTVGCLHRATFARDGDRPARSGEDGTAGAQIAQDLRTFRRKARAFDLDLDEDSAGELRAIDRLLHAGPVASFCVRDLNPRNVFVSASGVHVCDFEFAGFAHPFAEGLNAGWLFPLSVECGALPDWLTQELQDTYRREFVLPDAAGGERADTAALVDFTFQYWIHSSPEVGLPVAFAGGRAKVLELTERIAASDRHMREFPSIARLLVSLGDKLRRQNAVAPDTSCPYDCFKTAATATATRRLENHGSLAAPGPVRGRGGMSDTSDMTGVYAVNRHCHLIVRVDRRWRMSACVLEAPGIQCDGVGMEHGLIRATTMPLTMIASDDGTLLIRDERTGKSVRARRVPLWRVACSHPIAVLRFCRDIVSKWMTRLLASPSAVTGAHA
jgi:hypothetical protein